jgi:hypothetical protein
MGNHSPSVSRCGIYTGLLGIIEMNTRIKELARQSNIHFSRVGILDGDPNGSARMVGYSKMEKFAELIVGHAIECVRDVLRDENSDLSYAAASQVQNKIKQHFGVKE